MYVNSTLDMISRPKEPLESALGALQRSNGTQLVLSTFYLEVLEYYILAELATVAPLFQRFLD